MIFSNYPPSPQLNGIVKIYQLRHFEFPPGQKIPYKQFPPRDEQYLVFYVKGSEQVYSQGET